MIEGIYGAVALTSLIAVVMACRIRRLWPPTIGVCATAVVIVFYVPVRVYFHPPVGSDPVGYGFGLFAEVLGVVMLLGPLHLIFFALVCIAAL